MGDNNIKKIISEALNQFDYAKREIDANMDVKGNIDYNLLKSLANDYRITIMAIERMANDIKKDRLEKYDENKIKNLEYVFNSIEDKSEITFDNFIKNYNKISRKRQKGYTEEELKDFFNKKTSNFGKQIDLGL